MHPTDLYQLVLPIAQSFNDSSFDLSQEGVSKTGANILRLFIEIISGRHTELHIAEAIKRAWASDFAHAEKLINTTLILLADHDLNSSAFTARVVASTRATPYHVISASLSALSGYKHGGASEKVESFLIEIEALGDIEEAIKNRLKRGDVIFGFGHIVYRGIDPRAKCLMDQIELYYGRSKSYILTKKVIEVVHRLTSHRYNIDLALATLVRVLKMPPGSGVALFALARTIGWIGHAMEQYQNGRIIRPRSKYIGNIPEGRFIS